MEGNNGKPAGGRLGRPNTLYFDLLEQVKRDWTAGTWISIRSFANPTSAFVSKRAIEQGKRPIPGEVGEWEFSAHKEDIEDVDGQRIPGSVLYARWLGPVAKPGTGIGMEPGTGTGTGTGDGEREPASG